MSYALQVGDPAPEFNGKDQNGKKIRSEDLLGRVYVIYFYPMDSTPGCTKQACNLRDNIPNFDSLDVTVIGVSPDGQRSHEKFTAKHKLNFTLLTDEDKTICKKFDVWRSKSFMWIKFKGVERSTFIVDAKGVIRWIERPVKVKDHEKRILEALKTL